MNHLRKLTPADFRATSWRYGDDEPSRHPMWAFELMARHDFLRRVSLPQKLSPSGRLRYRIAWDQEARDANEAINALRCEAERNGSRS